MKIEIVYNGVFSVFPFRNNVMKRAYHINKCVSYIFTKCLRNEYSTAHKAIIPNSTLNILKPPQILLRNNELFSKLTPYSNFNIQSLWEVDINVEDDDKVNNLNSKTPETMTLGKEACRQEDQVLRFLKINSNRAEQLTNKEWQEIKRTTLEMPGNIHEENVDAYIMNMCCDLKSLQLGKSYYMFLKSTNTVINRPTFGSYLRLFYLSANRCTQKDLEEIHLIYKELLKVYPTIDCYTAEKAVAALSITKYWKEYERLFRIIKMSYEPTVHVYGIVISAAFRNKEFDLGWSLINEMKHQWLPIPDDVFISWLECQKIEDREMSIHILLEFFTKFNMKPSLVLCEKLKSVIEEHSNKIGVWSSITRRGNCRYCHSNLEKAWVNEEDFHQLKEAFLNPVLIGKDIFLKTQPQEFEKFLKFLEGTAPYDVVLDGLNVSLYASKSRRSPSVFSFQLKSVVRKFTSEDKKVLVIGKKHMLKWPKQDMQEVFDNAHVFLAEDMSHDDPFLLYATLYSGLGTMFVSRDMMRGHKCLLADPLLQATFHKWQAQHQYFVKYIETNGYVQLSEPIPFMQTIQTNSRGDWHIPYVLKEDLTEKDVVDNLHKHWLCVSNHQARPLPNRPGQSFRPQFKGQDRPQMDRTYRPRFNQPDNLNKRR